MRIASLRQHLEEDPKQPKYILTVQGLGYKLRADEPDAATA
jgi:DNA-binding response OmpR family regulator